MSEDPPDVPSVSIGQEIHDDNGRLLGTVRGFDEDGFFVTTREGIEALSLSHEHPGPEFGEGYLMWRCSNCGEMGELDDEPDALPEQCPNCGEPKEQLYYWTED